MCRFIVYKGAEPIQLSHLVTRPRHSIINQAFESKLRFPSSRPMNADGFGIGWYDPLPPPVPFHQTQHHSSNSSLPSDPNGVPSSAPITPVQSNASPPSGSVTDDAEGRAHGHGDRHRSSSSSSRQRSNLAHPNSTDIHPDKQMRNNADAEDAQPSPPGSPAPFSPTNRGKQDLPSDAETDRDDHELDGEVEGDEAKDRGVVMASHVTLSDSHQQETQKKQDELRRVRAEERLVENERPCVYKSISPAWSNANLTRLAEKIRSGLIFAHVRASTMPGAPSEDNCHPWIYGKLMWMHNGELSNFTKIKRKLQQSLPEELFLYPSGYTDSEWVFMVFLSKLKDPKARSFTHQELRDAMMETLRFVNKLSKEAGIESPHLLNYVVTDGETVVAIRYISSRKSEASSLFFSSGTSFDEYQDGGLYRMTRADKRENIVMIASEPLTFERSDWMEVKTNTMLIVTPKMNILQIPIVDEFWVAQGDKDAHKRSTDYAVEMGFGHGFASMNHEQEVTVA